MAYPLQAAPGPQVCEGRYRPLGNRGTGYISGTTKIDGVESACRVSLFTVDGTQLGHVLTLSGVGTYTFYGLWPQEYYLVIADNGQTVRRAKVEHTIVT